MKARDPGKFCSARTTKVKVRRDDVLSRELFAQSMFSMFREIVYVGKNLGLVYEKINKL